MKKLVIFSVLTVLLFTSCLGRKKKYYGTSKSLTISQYYSNGDYYNSFRSAVEILKIKSTVENKNEALSVIEDSYLKYLDNQEKKLELNLRTLKEDINYDRVNLETDNDTKRLYKDCAFLQETYNLWRSSIELIGPLYYGGRELTFPIKNYSEIVTKARDKYSDFLFRAAKSHTEGLVNSLSHDDKSAYRQAYDIYVRMQEFDITYKRAEVTVLKDEAFKKGQSYISVTINNLPKEYKRTEKDLVNSLDLGRWITIGKDGRGKYDFNFAITIEKSDISKGDVRRTVFEKEKRIIVENNQTDRDRRSASSRDRFIKSRLEIIDLHKDILIRGTIKAINNYTKKMNTSLLEVPSQFVYSYALQDGDVLAIDPEYLPLLENAPLDVPNDYEMIEMGLSKFKNEIVSTILNELYYRK
ncbi:hypothetical protein [Flavobacterium sp. ACN6]|uniref:hypothetical protein n=1 Tax=Flavobacterium sp. ACN6 TaxID=1920426 RepID=UPI000BB35E20|nr:hypothetical protein [Flavobacterium sp. ACN6]PBJ12280.1 hypothetical protein BSF42_22350 [Flavobacterium sp. ACN6]